MPSLPDWEKENRQLDEPVPSACLPIEHFQSVEHLKSWARISEYRRYWDLNHYWIYDADSTLFLRESIVLDGATMASSSLTNNQVAGVDEADFMKTDGSFMYVGSGSNLLVIRAYPPQEAQVLQVLPINGSLLALLIDPLHLVVVSAVYSGASAYSMLDMDWSMARSWGTPNMLIRVYDRTLSPLVLTREVELSGNYLGARTIANHLFLVSSFTLQSYNGTVMFPTLRVDGDLRTLGPSDIGFIESSWNQSSLLSILHMELGTLHDPELTTILASGSGTLYVSPSNAYLAAGRWNVVSGASSDATLVHKVPLRRVSSECVASAMVPGHIDSQFSLDEFDGNLRIATTSGTLGSRVVRLPGPGGGGMSAEAPASNAVYVLDANMTLLGSLEGLAPGESIKSARFMGDRLYLVTFKKVDPLFVIDLSNPAHPTVLGSLKIPGFSEYLHPIGDGLLIGVGRDTIESTTGDSAWFQGLKISLFDVSDLANPRELAHYVIGDRGTWSPVLTDHHAFTWVPELGSMILPVHVFDINETRAGSSLSPTTWGDEVWQGAYVISVSREHGFKVTQRISHHDVVDYPPCWTYTYQRTESITRSFYVDGNFYTLSGEFLQAHNAHTGNLVMSLDLIEGPTRAPWCPPPPTPDRPPAVRNGD